MSDDLSDFFKLLSQEKKQKKSEFNEIIGDLNLDDVFAEVSNFKKIEKQKKLEEKNKKEKELKNLVGEVTLDSVFTEVKTLKKLSKNKQKKKKEKEEKALVAFENFLHNDEVSETEEVQKAVEEWIEEVVNENESEEIIELESKVEELVVEEETKKVKEDKDPLTPLTKDFVTFKDLQDHYKLFINRIQQQLSSLGGGGETRLEFLDDVDRNSAKTDGYYLKYEASTGKFVGSAVTTGGGEVGAGGTWSVDNVGIHTIKSVGIGTTSAKPDKSLYVVGDVEFTGNVSVAGTITYEDVTNVDSIGIVTARSGISVGSPSSIGATITSNGDANFSGIVTASRFYGEGSSLSGVVTSITAGANIEVFESPSGNFIITATSSGGTQDLNSVLTQGNTSDLGISVGISTFNATSGVGTVYVGLGSTALYVDGSARITGILTVGKASVTIDGDNNTITTGIVTITESTVYLGDNIILSGNALGINSAPNVVYVAKDGSDTNNGTSIDNAFLTIEAAIGIATTGTIIKVLAGNYLENNPLEVPPFVSIVGTDLKTVTVSPNNASEDIFHVRKGCYISNITFTNHISPSAAISFPTLEIATNVGGGQWESPYIQNCTSNTTTGTGLRIDGAQAEGLKSIVCDSYTQYNQGGVGVAITNGGYAQLVSVFTICCDVGISCHKGAQCSITNSNTSFGTYGLVSDGISDLQFSGIVTSSSSAGQDTIAVAINTAIRPYDGQIVYFDNLYFAVETITVTNGGSGYLTTPSVTISSPDGPNGQTATAFATLNGGSVESISIISSGNQYSSPPTITISAPDSGVTATASANMTPLYYTINSSTPVTAGITTLTIDENLNNTIGAGVTAYFYQVSRISASSHTFEYVGSGNDIASATPLRGGVPNQENEVIETNGGKVIYTSTDQSGNFRIGNELQINQNTGTISGRSFTRSLFAEMTPFILALS